MRYCDVVTEASRPQGRRVHPAGRVAGFILDQVSLDKTPAHEGPSLCHVSWMGEVSAALPFASCSCQKCWPQCLLYCLSSKPGAGDSLAGICSGHAAVAMPSYWLSQQRTAQSAGSAPLIQARLVGHELHPSHGALPHGVRRHSEPGVLELAADVPVDER
jgi:hypothetical protein